MQKLLQKSSNNELFRFRFDSCQLFGVLRVSMTRQGKYYFRKQFYLEVVIWKYTWENGISAGSCNEIAQQSNIDVFIYSLFKIGW